MGPRIHHAAVPLRTLERPSRIVQPCGRCGIVLSEYDEKNPPSAIGPGPHTHAWWEGSVERDPGYPDGTAAMLCMFPDDAAEHFAPGVKLCDPGEVPADVETFTEQAAAG